MHSLTLRKTQSTIIVRVIGVAIFAVLTGISARISVLLPFTPVPLTLQVLCVLLSGLVLGPVDGLAAQLVYLQAILLGAPLTATGLAGPAAFVAPTAGYLLSFPAAAMLTGWLSTRHSKGRLFWHLVAALAGVGVIYLVGMSWLSFYVGGIAAAWTYGAVPFILVDVVKAVLASALLAIRR